MMHGLLDLKGMCLLQWCSTRRVRCALSLIGRKGCRTACDWSEQRRLSWGKSCRPEA